MRPLEGVRVLDLSRLLPGPFCTLILSDLGARVDKVEDPHVGDYLRLFPPLVSVPRPDGQGALRMSGRFAAINRDKRSLCLDLKQDLARQAFLKLLPRYDVLVESFRPGVLDRLGLGVSVLLAANPRLVVCSISGYGQDGPYRERAGHDLNYVGLAGVLGLCGQNADTPPHPLPIQLADLGAGALWPAVQILAALRVAERSGQGSHLDVAMCEGALSFLIPDLGNLAAQGSTPPRGLDLLTGGAACYGVYQTADKRYLSVAALEPKFWLAFNTVLGRVGDTSELVAPPAEQVRIRQEIQAILGQKTREQWLERFASTDACVEPVLELDELAQHPQHQARSLFFDLPLADGDQPLPQVRTPALRRNEVNMVCPPPGLGEHSLQILREAGLSEQEVAQLLESGATAAGPLGCAQV